MIFRDWQTTRWMLGNWFRWKLRRLILLRTGNLHLLFNTITDAHPFDIGELLKKHEDVYLIRSGTGPEAFLQMGGKLYWQTCRVTPKLKTLDDINREIAYRAARSINAIVEGEK